MADDTEKRLHSVMDKLFRAPKKSSPSSVQVARGVKRPYSMIASKSKGNDQDASASLPCKPWDRGDLMRRLATFKSMTWFAKPKVIDAVNCARRGWINVEMDTIACEVCGARLLFTTPSSWNQQQVEKAASVFSLKLDNGHKMLCPWTDNCCDETLALFPPTPAEVSAEHYMERFSALMQLLALPLISASAIDSMKTPQLEQFLKRSVTEGLYKSPDGPCSDLDGNDSDILADSYFQAHKLLSLCGWEPRLLPYVVDCNEGSNHSTNADPPAFSQPTADKPNYRLTVYSCAPDVKDLTSDVQYDPNSTVLECKLCGACIGLWAFALVSRPLELLRVVGYAEPDSSSNPENNNANGSNGIREAMLLKGGMPRLSMTIAGGPPPTQQNFKAKISLPVIGRNLRARFSSASSTGKNASETVPASDPRKEGANEGCQDVEAASNRVDTSSLVLEDNGKPDQGSGKLHVQESINCVLGSDHDDRISNEEVVGGLHLKQKESNETVSVEQLFSAASDNQSDNTVGNSKLSASEKDGCSPLSAKDLKGASVNKRMEFDPLHQHRHFCPWVSSAGTIAPGWKQTFSALQKEKVFTLTDPEDSPASPSLINVDDPITSIRWLFKSPSSKVKKAARQSK